MAQFVTKFAEPGEPEYSPPIVEAETPVMFSYLIKYIRVYIVYVQFSITLVLCVDAASDIHFFCYQVLLQIPLE